MRSFLYCYNSFSLSWSASYNLRRTEDFLYLTRNKKLSRQFLLSWFGFEIEELSHNHPNTSFPPTHNIYTIIHYYTLLYTIIHYYTLLYTFIHYDTLWYIMIHYFTLFHTTVSHCDTPSQQRSRFSPSKPPLPVPCPPYLRWLCSWHHCQLTQLDAQCI